MKMVRKLLSRDVEESRIVTVKTMIVMAESMRVLSKHARIVVDREELANVLMLNGYPVIWGSSLLSYAMVKIMTAMVKSTKMFCVFLSDVMVRIMIVMVGSMKKRLALSMRFLSEF